MTKTSKKGKRKSFSTARAVLGIMSVATLFLILFFPTLAIDYMNRGMKLCVGTVIPSLFPFMVASELIVLTGAARPLGRLLRAPARLLFGISGEGASAFVLGTVCGFPIGTRAAVSLYRRGRISLGELSRLVCFSNNPSSAFVISAVGTTFFGSREFGSALFLITILSSVIVGIGQNMIIGKERGVCLLDKGLSDTEKSEKKGISEFSAAVSSSAYAMLGVCAFVVFFSTLTGTLGVLLSGVGASQITKAIFFSFVELTGGVAEAAGVRPMLCAVIVAAFAVGWSGISVHLQMIGICGDVEIPLRRYFTAKLFQGLINVILVWAYMKFFGDTLSFEVKSVGAFLEFGFDINFLSLVICVAFVLSLTIGAFIKLRNRIL